MKIFISFASAFVFLALLVFVDYTHAQVGAIGEEQPAPTPQLTVLLSGNDCDINEAEAAVLRLEGIQAVNIEAKPNQMIVDYDSAQVNSAQILKAVKDRLLGADGIAKRMGGEKAEKHNCVPSIAGAAVEKKG